MGLESEIQPYVGPATRVIDLKGALAVPGLIDENIKGSLKAGKLADITVLSRDIMTVPEDQIPSTEVLYTIVGGKVEFTRRPEGTR